MINRSKMLIEIPEKSVSEVRELILNRKRKPQDDKARRKRKPQDDEARRKRIRELCKKKIL